MRRGNPICPALAARSVHRLGYDSCFVVRLKATTTGLGRITWLVTRQRGVAVAWVRVSVCLGFWLLSHTHSRILLLMHGLV